MNALCVLRNCIATRLVRYYVALRLSAAAASPDTFHYEQIEQPTPIVQFQALALTNGFDERELLKHQGDHLVLTVDLRPGSHADTGAFSVN